MGLLPGQISIQTVNALKRDPHVYESHTRLIYAHNQVVSFLGPGHPVSNKDISVLGLGTAPTYSVSGTLTRGRLSLLIGASPATPASVTLGFPTGTWSTTPFAVVARNGGTGVSTFSWTESPTQLTLTLDTPLAGETYTFQYAIRN